MSLVARARQQITPLRIQMAIGFGAKGVTAVAAFVLSWLIARQFGATGVGMFSLAQTTVLFGASIALLGLEYLSVREVSRLLALKHPGEARRFIGAAVRQTAVAAFLLAIALFLLRKPIAVGALDVPEVAAFLGVMALTIPIVGLTKIASAALRGSGHVLASQTIDGPIGTGLTALVLGAAMLMGYARDPLLPAVLYVGFGALSAMVGWTYLMRQIRRWPPADGPRPELLKKGLPLFVIALSQLFTDWFALTVLAAHADAAQVGLYRIAFQIVSVMNLLIVASEGIIAPVIAANYAIGNKARIAQALARTSALLIALASPIIAVCLIWPEWILSLFGPEFTDAALALRILAVGQIVNLTLGPIGSVLTMTHHERWPLAFGFVAAAIAAGLCLWLIPLYGVTGAAVAVTAAILFRRLAAATIVRLVVGIELWRWKAPVGTQQ